MHTSNQKQQLRQLIAKHIAAMSAEQRYTEGQAASRVLLEHLPEPATICAYYPLEDELDIRPVIETLMTRGDAVYLPVYGNESITFRQLVELTDLPQSPLNIPEPPTSAPELTDQVVNVVLVPGRAFDQCGHRLGRGRGGYDRWITNYRKSNPNTTFWGVGFACQFVPAVAVEAHDATMDAIVTAQQFLEIKK